MFQALGYGSVSILPYGSDKGLGEIVMQSAEMALRNTLKPPIISLWLLHLGVSLHSAQLFCLPIPMVSRLLSY